MITIHVYCSYRLSPVGYQYGVLKSPVSGGGDYCALDPPDESPATRFVKTAFDNGFITNVRGKIPDSSSYVFLVKRYHHSYSEGYDSFPEGHAGIGEDVSMNMAFEFDDPKEYMRFAASFRQRLEDDEAELKREMADMIHPDYAVSDYALNVNRKNLTAFMDKMLGGKSDAQPSDNTVFSVLSAQKDYCEELAQLFGLDDVYRSDNPKEYVSGKKKPYATTRQLNLPVLILVIGLILLILLGVFLLARSQKREAQNQTEVSVQEEAQLPILSEETENPEETESPEEAENLPEAPSERSSFSTAR